MAQAYDTSRLATTEEALIVLFCLVDDAYAMRNPNDADEPVAVLYCSCEQKPQIWGEFWWTGEKHDWVFFDNRETSDTYVGRITSCSVCGQGLERKNLKAVT